MEKFQRRAEDVAILIREAFLRGISTRQVGRIVATFTEPVSAQTVSRLIRTLDEAVRQFHQAWLKYAWAYLEKVRKRDYEQVKGDAQRIYLADSQRAAQAAFQRFRKRWRRWSSNWRRICPSC